MAIGLRLLFGLNMLIGVTLSLFDTLIIMYLVKKGIRTLEAIIIALISIIGISFVIELFFAKPEFSELVKGIFPSLPDYKALYIAIGIIGATVMPHNLYLHSSLVQTRNFERNSAGKRKAIRFNMIDTTIALNLALFVNAAILILAASTFYKTGHHEVEDIIDAHKMLAPLLGTVLAPVLFAVALIASGQSSTLTGTLTGQIVMEGYLNIRIAPWLRRLITRLMAVIPAFITILFAGESMAGALLILSQVILSLQLGFAILPLLHWVSSKKIMGEFRIKTLTIMVTWLATLLIIYLNLKMVIGFILDWMNTTSQPIILYTIVLAVVAAGVILLLYTLIEPVFGRLITREVRSPHPVAGKIVFNPPSPFKTIGICTDFSDSDIRSINYGLKFGTRETQYILIHIVESAAARAVDSEVKDVETKNDTNALDAYISQLALNKIKAERYIGFGQVTDALPEVVKEKQIELLIMSSHRKGFLHRLFKGTVINKIQRRINIPVFIAK